MKYHDNSLDWLKLRSMTVPNVCEDVEDGNYHTLPVRQEYKMDTNTCENNLALSCKVEPIHTRLPSNNSTPGHES